MNNKITIKAIIGLLFISTFLIKNVKAQFDPMFTQFMNNEMFINPACAGSKDALAITLLHRQQWVKFAGRPITTTFAINSPVYENKMGVGIAFLNEKIGVLNRNLLYASYAYRLRTGERSFLSFGLMAGMHMQVEKFADLDPNISGDPSFSTNTPVIVTPNFGFGTYFNTDKFYASFSIPRMLDDHIVFSSNGTRNKGIKFNIKSWHYYIAAGRVFTLHDYLKLKPHIMMKIAVNAPVEFDISLNALIRELIWVGVSYRSSNDIIALAGIQIRPSFLLGYSYDYQLSKIRNFSGGTHEITASYYFGLKGKKIMSPRYF